ncbi:hypothetical protein HYY69_06550 [Candidatus Woesearchaeota archaeon]|nr:hypothetical protein [Candidatus Woesearchaeota archaeon]
MKEKEISSDLKKNILDLQYNKYMQYFNTAIIILFTYFIGIGIAFVTKQVGYNNPPQLLIVAVISLGIITPTILLMLKFKDHMNNILDEIKNL